MWKNDDVNLITNYSIKFNKTQNKHVDGTLYDKVSKLPILIAFGKGNGKIDEINMKVFSKSKQLFDLVAWTLWFALDYW